MRRLCGVRAETLIAYADGDLDATQHAELEEHLKTCWACRERLQSSEDIGRMLRARFPLHDDPQARAEIMRQVRAVAAGEQQPQPARFALIRRLRSWPIAAAASLVLVLVIGFGLPMTTEADFRIGRFVSFMTLQGSSGPKSLPASEASQHTPVRTENFAAGVDVEEVAFPAVVPQQLPPNFELLEATTPGQGGLQLVYTDNAGTIVQVVQTPADSDTAIFPDSRNVIDAVDGSDVVLHRSPTGAYDRAIWERDGVLFDLLLLRRVGAGPERDALVDIARTFIQTPPQQNSGQ